jgi:dihydropteroate synthase
MADVVAQSGAGVVLMHMQGTPATMQDEPRYANVVGDLLRFFRRCLKHCDRAGIDRQHVVIDPGIGFGKTLEHNLEILARLADFQRLGQPLCLGVSRKGFLGKILNQPTEQRLLGSVAAICYAMGQGAVQVVRVHDVREVVEAVTVCAQIRAQKKGTKTPKPN